MYGQRFLIRAPEGIFVLLPFVLCGAALRRAPVGLDPVPDTMPVSWTSRVPCSGCGRPGHVVGNCSRAKKSLHEVLSQQDPTPSSLCGLFKNGGQENRR